MVGDELMSSSVATVVPRSTRVPTLLVPITVSAAL